MRFRLFKLEHTIYHLYYQDRINNRMKKNYSMVTSNNLLKWNTRIILSHLVISYHTVANKMETKEILFNN